MNASTKDITKKNFANNAKRIAAIDIVLVLGTLLMLKYSLLSVEALWTYAGPISLLSALAVGSWRLRKRRESWANLGLGRPKSIRWTILWTLVALVVTIVVGILAESLLANLIGAPDEVTQAIDAQFQGRFENIPGNFPAYLFWLVTAWIIGGFTEEILFRGVLLTRFEYLFVKFPFAVFLAIALQAVLFGQQHYYYQGLAGWVATGAIAFVSGILYLAFKRNLWPLVLSHGLSNTLGLTIIYLS
ncbi:MAG: CPBP family intramembrane metalloprotease [Rhizobiales bacterium]|nr:CPBP family intramembrane metalloprotease [Hyphomicrobiales bacterium]NRB15791.1 CPBP family intramembrane metalloprotease [Hyphomicrobiales bacterium]